MLHVLLTLFVLLCYDCITVLISKWNCELFQCGMKGHYANKCPKGHLAFLSTTAAAGYEAHAQSKENHDLQAQRQADIPQFV